MPGSPFAAPWRKRRRSTGALVPPAPAAPDTPSTPSPANAATAYYTLLSWVSARATKFDIYLDTVNPPATIVVPKWNTASYVPTVAASTTYYWKIVAFNDGGSATGPVWSFTTPAATAVLFSLAGSIVTSNARFGSLSIHDVLGPSPNTGSVIFDALPTVGAAIAIGLGTLDNDHLIFGGEIQAIDQTYVGTPQASSFYPVTLIDHTFRLNRRRPFGTWTNTSATTIAQYLVSVFSTGFTSNHVQDGLPAISINFDGSQDFMTCMRALATAISDSTNAGKTKVDYAKDVWLYVTYTGEQPNPVDHSHPPLNTPSPIRFNVDLSQTRTRVYGKGHGESLLADVAVGETILPIADAVMFTASGGKAIAGTTSGGAQTQILTYDGVQLGGSGSLVGPGAAPSVAPTLTLANGVGLGTGGYQYGYTDVTAAGESSVSPLASVTTRGIVAAPSNAPSVSTAASTNSGSLTPGATYQVKVTYSTINSFADHSSETTGSPSGSNVASATGAITYVPNMSGVLDPSVKVVFFYRTLAGGATFFLDGFDLAVNAITIYNTGSAYLSQRSDASLATMPAEPVSNTTSVRQQVAVGAIAAGATGTTSRNLYRTAVGGSQLKLLSNIAGNVTQTFADSTPDSSLGVNAPTGDTSGLTQPSGQVNAGSTSLPTASAGPFNASLGGWALLSGSKAVRYTGVSGNTLTGIPASGPGAILTTVPYGSQVLPAPALTGINRSNGVNLALAKGATVAIWVQRDDVAAQTALGLIELDENGNPTDGIREYAIVDERSTEARMIALCDADLAIFSRPIIGAMYYTRDTKSKSGRMVSISLDVGIPWGQVGAFTIQSVELAFDGPALNPLYHVTATSVSFKLTDLLRSVALIK